MSMSTTYPVQLDLTADTRIARWRPLVQWLLAVPHFVIVSVLTTLRHVLTAISFVTVLFTKRIPRQVFDAIAMTYRYEWRSASYALFLHETYPSFDFQPAAGVDGDASAENAAESDALGNPQIHADQARPASIVSRQQRLARLRVWI